MIADLVTWLRAQLDDDERVARQLIASPGGFYLEAETEQTDLMSAGAHVFRWSPARVLREVEVKRKILDMCAGWIAEPRVEDWEIDRAEELCLQNDAGPTLLRLLALPYSDRDGYQEEWRP